MNSYQPFTRYIIGLHIISSASTLLKEFMIFGTANGLNKFDNCLASKPYLISSVPDEILTWEKHIEYTKYISQN